MTNLSTKQICHRIHRWGGLFLTAYILFYCLSGIALNHRQAFSYFLKINSSHQSIAVTSNKPVADFINFYKKIINRPDSPKVIRLQDNGKKIEFLYGFHGQTTYIITPATGKMEIRTKTPATFHWLNRLHKAFKTSKVWLVLSDTLAVILCLVTLIILMVMRYRPIDIFFLIGGVIICLAGVILA